MTFVILHGTLQRDYPDHESNSILLGPHVPRNQQDMASAEGFLFEVGDDVETRREDGQGQVRDIRIEGCTSKDDLIEAAKYPNTTQRTPLARLNREGQPKSISVSVLVH
ncbi:uncharacterized protein RAG0_01263 [Rhynchosporium agropyri]|uniref:Uncharacterized protein n=1 Tax=Rhynchosporium agropyri TaxID=914238 RepID=A0A1E1JW36_9HELO|nr:uncharacterized protein RAG0_01263 [Rhynchosporium agropyri]